MQQNLRVVKEKEQRKCPYLDTVDREKLDFDLEKVCGMEIVSSCRSVPFLFLTRTSIFVSSVVPICR